MNSLRHRCRHYGVGRTALPSQRPPAAVWLPYAWYFRILAGIPLVLFAHGVLPVAASPPVSAVAASSPTLAMTEFSRVDGSVTGDHRMVTMAADATGLHLADTRSVHHQVAQTPALPPTMLSSPPAFPTTPPPLPLPSASSLLPPPPPPPPAPPPMLQWREWFHPSESMTPAVSYRTLQEAILQKDLDGLQRLLDAGRSPDGLSDLRETPLELSLRLGEEGFAERLLHHGANPNLGSRATETLPLQQAIQAGQPTLVRLLLAHGATVQTRIPHALRMPMNHLDDTLLHVAAQGGRLDIVTLLVDAGARMDATNRAGLTPMEHAIAGDHVEVTAFFLNAGADLEHRGRIGTTPLHLAALEGSVQTVGLLLQRGARVNTRTRNGSTPLHAAVARGHADIARLLVAHGADVHAAGQRGESPLDIAHRMGNAELLAILQPATTPTTPMVPTTPVVPTTEHVL